MDKDRQYNYEKKNLCGWMREEPASLKLFFTFQDYGIHNEWIERPKEELDEIEEKLNKLKDSNCL